LKYDDLSNSELANLIDEWVRGLHADRNREILKDRLINGMLYEPLAEKHHLSVRAVQNIIYKTSEQLFKHIKL
jgi:Mor family transcriptional regulator